MSRASDRPGDEIVALSAAEEKYRVVSASGISRRLRARSLEPSGIAAKCNHALRRRPQFAPTEKFRPLVGRHLPVI